VKDGGSGGRERKNDTHEKKQLDGEVEGVGEEQKKKNRKEKEGRNKLSHCDICFSEWLICN
jgi:hypothetical protein